MIALKCRRENKYIRRGKALLYHYLSQSDKIYCNSYRAIMYKKWQYEIVLKKPNGY